MKKLSIFLFAFLFPFGSLASDMANERAFVKENMDFAVRQYEFMMKMLPSDQRKMPHSAHPDGTVVMGSISGWTAGFFPGTLWYLSDFENSQALRDSALAYTRRMEEIKSLTSHHDIGFMMNCSYGNALRFAPDDSYRDILIESARSLATRYRAKAGVIQSWNSFTSLHDGRRYALPVIIDNMMNLELLFRASALSGDGSFRRIAVSHAGHTMHNQLRGDHSCFHVTFYDENTGVFIKGETAQGYSDNSTWARGQAWGIYGFTMAYRETRDRRFLKTAEAMADYFIGNPNMPSDGICWWDFNAFQPGYVPGARSNASRIVTNYRDASAAAIAASALLELSTYAGNGKAKRYLDYARKVLHSLAGPLYRAEYGHNGGFILMHCVGSLPANSEIDVPLVYADYYFIEALYRYDSLLKGEKLTHG